MIDIMISTVKIFGKPTEYSLKAGEVVFQENEVQERMYGLIEGEVEVTIGDVFIETIKTGEIFGIGAMVHGDHKRASTTIAKTDCRLVSMDREHFLFAVQQTPMFALEALKSYSDRYRNLKHAYQAIMAKS